MQEENSIGLELASIGYMPRARFRPRAGTSVVTALS